MIFWVAVSLAGPEKTVVKLLDAGRTDAAQKKCERLSAFLPETAPAVREACAGAFWGQPLAEGSYKGWIRYQTDWEGTSWAKKAGVEIASARLRELGDRATEADYRALIDAWPGTPAADKARQLWGIQVLGSIDSSESAKHVVREFPTVPGLINAVAPWFQSFVVVDPKEPSARLEPAIPGVGVPTARWVVRRGTAIEPWKAAAVTALATHGLAQPFAEKILREEVRPCTLPDAELGLWVEAGTMEAFVPHPVDCGFPEPTYVSVRDGFPAGIGMQSGRGLTFARGSEQLAWGIDAVPLLGTTGNAVLLDGEALVQPVGGLSLYVPITGTAPFYRLGAPSPDLVPLPIGDVTPIPSSVTVVTAGERTQLVGPTWGLDLPKGSIRTLPPLFAKLSGLHPGNDAFKRPAGPAFPMGFWPESETVVALPLEHESVGVLKRFGIEAKQLWTLQLAPDPGSEIAFEGVFAGRPVRGFLDPDEGMRNWRLFLFEGTWKPETFVVFRHKGTVHAGWQGSDAGGTLMRAFRFEPKGLTVTWLRP